MLLIFGEETCLVAYNMALGLSHSSCCVCQAAVGSVVDPTSGEKMEKSVFMVFFAGDNARTKILKVWKALDFI